MFRGLGNFGCQPETRIKSGLSRGWEEQANTPIFGLLGRRDMHGCDLHNPPTLPATPCLPRKGGWRVGVSEKGSCGRSGSSGWEGGVVILRYRPVRFGQCMVSKSVMLTVRLATHCGMR